MKNLTQQGYSLTAAAERSLLGISKRNGATLLVFCDTEITSIAETDRKKTFELADVHVITVGAERFHHADELLQPSFTGRESAEFTTLLSRRSVTLTSAKICTSISCRLAAPSFQRDR